MTDLTPTRSSEHAKPGAIILRQRIAQALADYIDQTSPTDIAGMLGLAVSTVTRRECDLGNWPADELLKLALHHGPLALAMEGYLTGAQHREGHSLAIRTDLVVEISDSAKVSGKIAEALDDGRMSVAEARGVLEVIQERRRHEDERLIPDLSAAIRNIA